RLEPTMGMNSTVYNIFGINTAVFDLAGQELENWLTNDRYVLNNANVVICVLDVNMYLKKIYNFLEKILRVLNDVRDSKLIVFLHKFDSIDKLYAYHKLKALNNFVNKNLNDLIGLESYLTSITKEFFFKTFNIVSDIFKKYISSEEYFYDNSKIKNYKNDLKILMEYDVGVDIEVSSLFFDLELKTKEALFHLERLKKMGFVKIINTHNFFLTEKIRFLKVGFIKSNAMIDDTNTEFEKTLESLYIFSNFKS
ncbi:MAG: hypothetical protein JW891_10900, partial [Candidatus Lokiarchaeota archaeon]|nr:hypothetical protein [Candidatus Lokiarchaeota archaeon]